MRSTFYGLDIASKGLFVAQRQLDLTGHNLANANTVGYTRQRIIQTAIDPGKGTKWAHVASKMSGGGVRALTVDQIRDQFLDRQYRNELTRASYWDSKYATLYYVEDIFNNVDTDHNLGALLSGFFNSIQELSKNPTDGAVRKYVIEQAKSMISMLNGYYEQFYSLMTQQDDMLVAQARRVNVIGEEIAALNESIFKYELSGYTANDLRDKRNLLLDELSGLMRISYYEEDSGFTDINGKAMNKLVVTIGGEKFVDDIKHLTVEAIPDPDVDNDLWKSEMLKKYGAGPIPEGEMLHKVVFIDSGDLVDIVSGKMGAYLELRDGNSVDIQGTPFFKAQLDKLVYALVTEFNEIHRKGWTMPIDSDNDSVTGINFFDPNGLTIDTIDLSEAIKESIFNLAPAHKKVEIDPDTGDFETGNNEIALELAKLQQASDIDVIKGFGKYYNTFIAELASEVGLAKSTAEHELFLVDSLEDQRVSVSGVSLDEEMTNLIRFQQAYNAAARVITAMDEALDVLINRTGRVGL